jgi:hypothetical protein
MLRMNWVLAGVLLLSCGGDDSFNPTVDTTAGTYQLTTLKETQNGITLDHLALGVTAELILAADGTATGHLFAPHGAVDGSDLDTDLTGGWTLSDTTVTLSLDQDILFDDITLTVEPNQLRGNHTFTGNIAVEIVFTRTE